MIRTNNRSHAATLERCRIALDKAESNPGISQAMKKIGYNPDVMMGGKDLLASAWKIFDENLKKKDELSRARTEYSRLKAEMEKKYREHRNKALLIFRNEHSKTRLLGVRGKYPVSSDTLIESMRKFYGAIVTKSEIQERLQHLNLTKEDAEIGLTRIKKLEGLFAECLKTKGLSEQSTVEKNKAFEKLSDWMSDFYGVARLALKNEPELLETLYKSA